MSFEEIAFKSYQHPPKMKADEATLKYSEKKSYLRFNRIISEELINGEYKYCILEYNKDTNEIRLKIRKYKDDNAVRLSIDKKSSRVAINHKQFVRFIMSKMNITEDRSVIHVGDNKSNVMTTNTRYLTR